LVEVATKAGKERRKEGRKEGRKERNGAIETRKVKPMEIQ
jgi:hypothetical protein